MVDDEGGGVRADDGVAADAGVKVTGTLVSICCLEGLWMYVGDGRLCLAEPFAKAGGEKVAEGDILSFAASG